MYCPSCANPVKDGLKYCNGCGAKLGPPEKDDSPAAMLNDVLETLFWAAILGFGILVGLIAVLMKNEVRQDVVGIIAVAYLAVLGMICFMLAIQVPKLIDAKVRSLRDASGIGTAAQLRPLTTAQLEEFREPAMSVTEHTTRTLDKTRK